jgi:glycosyltransferase involved in cell wall biosynthesis
MKIALVHDWLNQVGGAEGVLKELVALFPDAPIYTSIYWPRAMPSAYQEWDIRTTWLNKLPLVKRHHRLFLPLYPLAFESLDLSAYQVVITNKSGFCHGIVTPPETLHICYCLTPTRYVWRYHDYAAHEKIGSLAHRALSPVLSYLRMWDRLAADRVDRFIAISAEVQRRIGTYYRRDAEIIYPPVDTKRFSRRALPSRSTPREGYFLTVGRLIPYKRIDLAVQACTRLNLPLKVGGTGRNIDRLRAMAGPTVEFLGYVPNAELPGLMAHCRAFLFPGAEDFGIAPVQAMAAGRPVIAYAYGGALDTVVEGVSGTLFHEQTVESLLDTLERFDDGEYDPVTIRRHAEQFDAAIFRRKIRKYVTQAYEEHIKWN